MHRLRKVLQGVWRVKDMRSRPSVLFHISDHVDGERQGAPCQSGSQLKGRSLILDPFNATLGSIAALGICPSAYSSGMLRRHSDVGIPPSACSERTTPGSGGQKSQCKECGGSGICMHGQQKHRCAVWYAAQHTVHSAAQNAAYYTIQRTPHYSMPHT